MNDEYLNGKKNWWIRMFFYANNGVSIVNDFRNIGLGVFALYFALKLENPLWLIVMFAACVPVLIIMGYYNVHHISRVKEWLSIKFGTYYGVKQFTYIEEQVKLLEKIEENTRTVVHNEKEKNNATLNV